METDVKTEVEILPAKLRFHGFTYTQICRGQRSCVYEQTVSPKINYYEVFKLRIQHPATLKGVFYPARERWPKDEDFGYTAWTCRTLERAMERFNEIENGRK